MTTLNEEGAQPSDGKCGASTSQVANGSSAFGALAGLAEKMGCGRRGHYRRGRRQVGRPSLTELHSGRAIPSFS
jgi:hypothetical protein